MTLIKYPMYCTTNNSTDRTFKHHNEPIKSMDNVYRWNFSSWQWLFRWVCMYTAILQNMQSNLMKIPLSLSVCYQKNDFTDTFARLWIKETRIQSKWNEWEIKWRKKKEEINRCKWNMLALTQFETSWNSHNMRIRYVRNHRKRCAFTLCSHTHTHIHPKCFLILLQQFSLWHADIMPSSSSSSSPFVRSSKTDVHGCLQF